jgi:hypothetical protein
LRFAQLSTSTAFRSSISGLSTERDTSTLNDIIYYSSCVDIHQELHQFIAKLSFWNEQCQYFIDVVINKVHNLEFQLGQCREDLFCISPLIAEIELDKIRLPQNIKSEVSSAEGLLTRLKLSVIQCSDDNI